MSDNDLIRRGDAKAHPFANGMYDCEHADKKFISGHESYKEWLDTVPAVEKPMSAVEFLKAKARMKTAMGFPGIADIEKMRDAVAFVEKWAREHPERSEE